MNIEWIRGGTLESAGPGLIHILRSIHPIITRPGDIVIAEYGCAIGGNAIAWAEANKVSLFVTSNGATKVYYWLPGSDTHSRLAEQIISSNTPYVIDAVARWMLEKRFNKRLHPARGLNVARGHEGAEVRKIYAQLATKYGVPWSGRQTSGKWDDLSPINKTISMCNAALYGLTEIAVIYAGYSPYFGFLHGKSGKALVYDIADIVKFEYVTPIAFRMVADGLPNPEWRARAACARLFRRSYLLRELIKQTEETMHVAFDALASGPPRRRRKGLS